MTKFFHFYDKVTSKYLWVASDSARLEFYLNSPRVVLCGEADKSVVLLTGGGLLFLKVLL